MAPSLGTIRRTSCVGRVGVREAGAEQHRAAVHALDQPVGFVGVQRPSVVLGQPADHQLGGRDGEDGGARPCGRQLDLAGADAEGALGRQQAGAGRLRGCRPPPPGGRAPPCPTPGRAAASRAAVLRRRADCQASGASPAWSSSSVFSAGPGLEVLVAGERLQHETAGSLAVAGDGGVGDRRGAVDLQQLGLVEPLQRVAERHDHRLVGEQPHPLAVVPLAQVGQQAARAQHHVGPALPGRRLVVELADVGAALGLLGIPRPDALAGQAVEQPEVALAQALVHQQLDVEVGQRGAGRVGGASVGRADDEVRSLPLREPCSPPAEGARLLLAVGGQLDVRVACRELEPLGIRVTGLVVGDVPGTLPVAHQHQLVGSTPCVQHARQAHRVSSSYVVDR